MCVWGAGGAPQNRTLRPAVNRRRVAEAGRAVRLSCSGAAPLKPFTGGQVWNGAADHVDFAELKGKQRKRKRRKNPLFYWVKMELQQLFVLRPVMVRASEADKMAAPGGRRALDGALRRPFGPPASGYSPPISRSKS